MRQNRLDIGPNTFFFKRLNVLRCFEKPCRHSGYNFPMGKQLTTNLLRVIETLFK